MNIIEIIEELKKANPYPEDIFILLTFNQKHKYQLAIIKAGLSFERLVADIQRQSWNNCIKKLEELVKKE